MKIIVKLFALFSLLVINISFGQSSKSFIAVLELEAEGITESESRIITERLRTALFKTDQFTVLERDKMNEILEEQGFQESGCTTNDCVVEIGKLIGVKEIVVGSIGKIGDMFTLNVRIIDIQSAKVLNMAVDDCDCIIEDVLVKSTERIALELTNQTTETDDPEKDVTNPEYIFNKRYILSPVFGYGKITGFGVGLRSDLYYRENFNLNFQYAYHYGNNDTFDGKTWYLVSEFGYLINMGDFVINPAPLIGIFNSRHNYDKASGLCYGFNFGVDYAFTHFLSFGFDFKGLYEGQYKLFLGGITLDLTL